MKLDRYVMKELLVPFLIGTVAVVLMFQANLLIFLYKTFSLSSVPIAGVAKLLLYKTPFFLNMTLPVGVALATSLGMTRLTRESELTAFRAAGASILRVMLPISLFGLIVGFCNFMLAERVMPNAEKEATKLNNDLTVLGGAPDFKANVQLTLGNYSAHIGTVFRDKDGSLQLNDVYLFERPQPFQAWIFQSRSGSYDNGEWTFPDGRLWQIQDDNVRMLKSDHTVKIHQRITINDIYGQAQPTEMSVSQLKQAIADGKVQHTDTTPLQVAYYTRFSVPAACYVFAIVGPVFAIWLGRGGGFVGVLLSILMVMLYYNVYIISTEVFGRNGWLSPVMAAWLPDVIFILFAVVGLRRLE